MGGQWVFFQEKFIVIGVASLLTCGAVLAAQKGQKVSSRVKSSVSADEILRRSDDVRCPSTSYFMEVEVENQNGDDSVRVEVYTKGRERTRVNTIAPVRDRGRNMLMIGEDMWAYIPNLRRAVRIALNQKLTGQAAIGDVSRMRWWGDYTAAVLIEDKRTWLLELTAAKKGLTYEKVKVKIEKATFRPMEADYLSDGGIVLKRAKFEAYRKIAGNIRPTQIVITDPHNSSDSSTLRIIKLEKRESPERFFNQNNLN
jgi:outer membrane lipoprotein-sorting protein